MYEDAAVDFIRVLRRVPASQVSLPNEGGMSRHLTRAFQAFDEGDNETLVTSVMSIIDIIRKVGSDQIHLPGSLTSTLSTLLGRK